MSDATNKDSKRLGLARPGKLELKKTVETGKVKQSFSHGRSKMVTVEVRKKRIFAPSTGGQMAEVKNRKSLSSEDSRVLDPGEQSALTDKERETRARALEVSNKVSANEDHDQVIGSPKKEILSEEEATEAKEENLEIGQTSPELIEPKTPLPKPAAAEPLDPEDEDRGRGRKATKTKHERTQLGHKRTETRRRSGKLTIAEAESFEVMEERTRSVGAFKRKLEREREKQRERLSEGAKVIREVIIPETITVQELANRMAERGGDVVKALMKSGIMATINQLIDADTAELVAGEFGHKVKRVSEADVEQGLAGQDDAASELKARAPVVTIMGHVDHGKTSLLDALRETDIVKHEAGGITQHIGAYQVTLQSGEKITFIDTPGHSAFTQMRARGAKVTDIIVLVVAADDSIMPQTIEAIDHAKAAGVPIIVAINKIDVPDAKPEKVRTELLSHDVQVEETGGDILCVSISALKKTNLDKLEEAILLQAELMDLKANPERAGEGVVIEAKMEKGKGIAATILVQRGTLKAGDIFVAGSEWGRVRAIIDSYGEQLELAGPSEPVEIIGLNGMPAAGDGMVVVESEGRAREVAEYRKRVDRQTRAAKTGRGTLEQMFERIKEGEAQAIPVVVKADVHGSVEAILGALNNLETTEIKVEVLHSGVGGINESDVSLARASQAVVIGFNVRANPQARELAKRDIVDIRYYNIIYDLTDDLKKLLSGFLSPELNEKFLGFAEIREIFAVSKVGKIAGCMVTNGIIKRDSKVRLLRDDVVIHEGDLGQLKRFKEDAREVKEGLECGIAFANFQDIQVGDTIECFELQKISRAL